MTVEHAGEKLTMAESLFVNLEPLVLASASPRRRELLSSMGIRMDVIPSHVEESEGGGGTPLELVERWAREKAEAVASAFRDSWVLAADTIVVLEGKIFGKPQNPEHAAAMLKDLSGKTHWVTSAFCLRHASRGLVHLASVSTAVHFRRLSGAEISAYVRTGECLDKAGAYGIQGLGTFLVRAIEGSYTNVVGLPLCETLECLMDHGVIRPAQTVGAGDDGIS